MNGSVIPRGTRSVMIDAGKIFQRFSDVGLETTFDVINESLEKNHTNECSEATFCVEMFKKAYSEVTKYTLPQIVLLMESNDPQKIDEYDTWSAYVLWFAICRSHLFHIPIPLTRSDLHDRND